MSICFHIIRRRRLPSAAALRSYSISAKPEVDEVGVPLKPTWSVRELLNSYASPQLSVEKLRRMHELSALEMAEEGTEEFAKMKSEMEEMVKLVEAVRGVEVPLDESGKTM